MFIAISLYNSMFILFLGQNKYHFSVNDIGLLQWNHLSAKIKLYVSEHKFKKNIKHIYCQVTKEYVSVWYSLQTAGFHVNMLLLCINNSWYCNI